MPSTSLSTFVRPRSLVTLGLTLALALALSACSGESKPAASSPTPEGTAKADGDAAKPGGDAANAKADGGDKVKVVEGAAPGKDDRYALQIEAPSEATAGQPAEVVVRVVPKEPWHMNLEFPTSLKLTPPEGVALANASLKKGDARKLDEGSCEFAVQVTPSAAGEHTVTGQFKFAVCQDEACSPVTEDVELKLAAK